MNDETKSYLERFAATICSGTYSVDIPCRLPKGHEGSHDGADWVRPMMSDARAEHPFPTHLDTDVCGMCGNPAAHKVEETTGPPGFHPLTNYLCCEHAEAVLGAAHGGYPYGQDFTSWARGYQKQESTDG